MEKLIYVNIARLRKSQDKCFVGSANDWYLIKQGEGGDGVELTRAFVSEPNPCDAALFDTTCEVIGSCIYVIGGSSIGHDWVDNIIEEGSNIIHFIYTRRPKDGWRICCTLPFIHGGGGGSVNVDDQWLCVFGGNRENDCLPWCPWGFVVNVNDSIEVRKLTPPSDLDGYPIISTCLSPGILNAYMFRNGTLCELDCKNSTWTFRQENLPYRTGWLVNCTTVVDDGILYIYDSVHLKFKSYDICKRKELYVVNLPRSFWFPRDTLVQLIVLSKNRFCIVWDWCDGYNELRICYSRFLVSFHEPKPKIDLEENKAFPVAGFSIVNVVAVDPNSDEANSSSVNGSAVHE